MSASRMAALVLVAAVAAGCTASGASTSNFELKPERIGWYAGDEAVFHLNLTPSLTKSDPAFTIDRQFAIEEIRFNERGVAVGGDYKTRNPNEVSLRLVRNGTEGEEFRLDPAAPGLELRMAIPDGLRDSEYVLELKLFDVGWVKSEPFRVDKR